ncbi:MAG: DUF2073 domain-containing protein [archaeon]
MAKRDEKRIGKLKGLSIQFLPYSEIRNLDSNSRIKKILSIVLGNHILILQGKLKPDEEARLIGDTMAMIGYVKDFKGIELAVIEGNGDEGIIDKIRKNVLKAISGGELGTITIIGPATVVKEIKKNPRKIELLLNK